MKRIFIILTLVGASSLVFIRCLEVKKPYSKFDSLETLFADSTKQKVADQLIIVEGLMHKMATRGNFTSHQMGYTYDIDLRFRHCPHGKDGRIVTVDYCQLDSLLSLEEKDSLLRGIEYLRSSELISCYYETLFKKFIYVLDAPFYEFIDIRYMCLTSHLDTTFVRKTRFRIISEKKGLTLLKERASQ